MAYQHRKLYTGGKKINIVSDSFHFHGLKGVIYIMHTILPLLQITIVQGFHSGKRIVIIVHVSVCIAGISTHIRIWTHGRNVLGPFFSLLFLILL